MDPIYQFSLQFEKLCREADTETIKCFVQEKLKLTEAEFGPDALNRLKNELLMSSVFWASLPILDYLLDQCEDLDLLHDDGYTYLLASIDREYDKGPTKLSIAENLLKRGANPNVTGINGWSALHMALVREQKDMAELLMKYGADPKLKTNIDNYATPEEEARLLGKVEIAGWFSSLIRTLA